MWNPRGDGREPRGIATLTVAEPLPELGEYYTGRTRDSRVGHAHHVGSSDTWDGFPQNGRNARAMWASLCYSQYSYYRSTIEEKRYAPSSLRSNWGLADTEEQRFSARRQRPTGQRHRDTRKDGSGRARRRHSQQNMVITSIPECHLVLKMPPLLFKDVWTIY